MRYFVTSFLPAQDLLWLLMMLHPSWWDAVTWPPLYSSVWFLRPVALVLSGSRRQGPHPLCCASPGATNGQRQLRSYTSTWDSEELCSWPQSTQWCLPEGSLPEGDLRASCNNYLPGRFLFLQTAKGEACGPADIDTRMESGGSGSQASAICLQFLEVPVRELWQAFAEGRGTC